MASDIGAAGAAAILSAGQKKPGQFNIKSDAANNIKATLDQLASDANSKQMLNSALRRLQGIAEGIIEPDQSREWETVGGFLQLTGQPFKLGFDDRGQLSVQPQSESDLSEYTPRQRQQLRAAMEELSGLVSDADLEDTKTDLQAQLAFGMLRIEEMKAFSPAEAAWEKQYLRLQERGVPVKLSLDADGNLFALDQLEHDFADVENEADRLKLIQARRDLENILNGAKTATETWHFEALGFKIDKEAYFLDLDEDGNISVERNKLETVTPDFLTDDNGGPAPTEAWQEKALQLYSEKKSFHLDFGPDGRIEVVENNFLNVTRQVDIASSDERMRSALVSLLA